MTRRDSEFLSIRADTLIAPAVPLVRPDDMWDRGVVEPMRPVDYVEQPPDPGSRRKQRWWRMFFVCLMICQFIALTVYDIEFWWVVLAGATAFGLYELLWAVLSRAKSPQG